MSTVMAKMEIQPYFPLVRIDDDLMTVRILMAQETATTYRRNGANFEGSIPDMVCPAQDAQTLWEHDKPDELKTKVGGRMILGEHLSPSLDGHVLTEINGLTLSTDHPRWREEEFFVLPQIGTEESFGSLDPWVSLQERFPDRIGYPTDITYDRWKHILTTLDRNLLIKFQCGPTRSFFDCSFWFTLQADQSATCSIIGTPVTDPGLFTHPVKIFYVEGT